MSSSSGLGDPDQKPHRKTSSSLPSTRRRHCSGELDVFEAAGYYNSPACSTQKILGEDDAPHSWRSERRISLDVPIKTLVQEHRPRHPSSAAAQILKDKGKAHRQPSSPGGRLASFLNSLFHQAALKRNKKSSSKGGAASAPERDGSPGGGGRRKRRFSISHFRSTSAAVDTSSLPNPKPCSSSTTGFRTPPHPRARSDHNYKHVKAGKSSTASNIAQVNASPSLPSSSSSYNNRNRGFSWLDEKLRLGGCSTEKKNQKNPGGGFSERDPKWVEDRRPAGKELGRFDHGGDSDSSSDLFELENYDVGLCSSSGLPVYETTHMDSIRRAATISNGGL